jgi:hypothetical protein
VNPRAYTVLHRWLAAADNEVPAKNRDTGRIVWVLPETLRDNPGKFQKPRPDEDPTNEGPKPPAKPAKPRRPRIPLDPPPAPIKPPEPPEVPEPPKIPSVPEPADPPKVPKPSPHRKWKIKKKYQG